MTIDSEKAWIAQALDGDDIAFSHLVEAFQRPVFSVCYRMLGNARDAEDAAQESFLRAYKNLYRYDPDRSFATWLLSITSHYCIDQLRKRRLVTFSIDDDENWWLKVFGKSRKLRDITVPIDFLPFLERYRSSRSLLGLPSSNENSILVEKVRGQGGMTSRHLRRLVQNVFDQAHENMRRSAGENKALKLKEASAHWLRHTGASMEIERGRPLKDISEDLGHAEFILTYKSFKPIGPACLPV